MFVVSIVLVICTLLGFYVHRVLNARRAFWLRRRTPCAAWPHLLYGNIRGIWNSEHSSTLLQKIYNDFKKRRLAAGGFNVFFSPSILVVDPEIVEQVLVTDAHVFRGRGLHVDKQADPLSCTLFGLSGMVWKQTKDKLEPIFSAGLVKTMFGVAANVADELRVEIQKNIVRGELNVQDLVARYSTHSIGTCVFGIRCRTIQFGNSEFRAMGNKATEFSWHVVVKQWAAASFSKLAQKIGVKTTDCIVEKFFMDLCKATVLHRESYGVEKQDLLQHFISLRRNQQLTMEELSAQCYSFVKYGIGTCSSVMTFCLYELSKNPVVQDRLRKEINHSLEDTDGQLTYEVVMSMSYLEQVVNETIRKYPPVDYLFRRSENMHNHIPKGTLFVIPVYALHHDPDHFPSPEQFDPERFAAGRTKTRHPYSYLPFGVGPRSCIGNHFSLMLVKIGLLTLVRSFSFVPNEGDDSGKLRFKPNSMVLSPVEGCVRVKIERI